MMRAGFSIGQRLGLGFALLFAVLAALVGVVWQWQEHASAAQAQYAERIAPLAEAAQDLQSAVLYAGIAVRAYLLRPGGDTEKAYAARLAQAHDALERLRHLPKSEEAHALFLALAPPVSGYLEATARVVGEGPDGRPEGALAAARERAVGALERFSALQKQHTAAALREMEASRRRAGAALLYAGGAALVLFALFAALIARSIRRPTKELLGVAAALQAGDWLPALAWAPKTGTNGTRDELIRIGQAFGSAARALERREQRLRVDRAVAAAAASSLEKTQIAAAALDAVCEHLHAEVGALYWRVEDVLQPVGLRALGATLEPLAIGEGIPGRAAAELRTVVLRELPPDTPFRVKLGYDAAPPKSLAAVPLALRGELIGVLVVASLRVLDDEAVSFLESAAAQLAVGLENVRGYEKIRELLAELEHKSGLLRDQNEELQVQSEEIQAQNEELQAQAEEIRAQNDQLKDQAGKLRAFADSLEEADRRKNEFLGVLAHELRNPMAAIGNSIYTLANSPNPESRRRAEQVIGRQTRLLTRLVDDLLDVTRISRGKVRLQRESVDLAELVRECVEDYAELAGKAGVSIELAAFAGALTVDGDRARLAQIVGNLLDNAVKFAGADAAVRVALRAADGHAELRVADQGVGIEREVLARLFQPFSQADESLARRKGGLGLGLSLARGLAELHGGSVEAASEGLGKGAAFTVRLPLAGTQATRAEVRQPAAKGSTRRVLIVEDNADAARTLKDALDVHGHEVRLAADAGEALALAEAFAPEVVLCDIGLPSLDGYELARRLRADERFRSTFMIAVTGYAGPDDQQRAAQAGFDRHFGKPADVERLCRLLGEITPAAQALSR